MNKMALVVAVALVAVVLGAGIFLMGSSDEGDDKAPQLPDDTDPEVPENPDPEVPENPDPEVPDNPGPENPDPEIPENPDPEIPDNPVPSVPDNPDTADKYELKETFAAGDYIEFINPNGEHFRFIITGMLGDNYLYAEVVDRTSDGVNILRGNSSSYERLINFPNSGNPSVVGTETVDTPYGEVLCDKYEGTLGHGMTYQKWIWKDTGLVVKYCTASGYTTLAETSFFKGTPTPELDSRLPLPEKEPGIPDNLQEETFRSEIRAGDYFEFKVDKGGKSFTRTFEVTSVDGTKVEGTLTQNDVSKPFSMYLSTFMANVDGNAYAYYDTLQGATKLYDTEFGPREVTEFLQYKWTNDAAGNADITYENRYLIGVNGLIYVHEVTHDGEKSTYTLVSTSLITNGA